MIHSSNRTIIVISAIIYLPFLLNLEFFRVPQKSLSCETADAKASKVRKLFMAPKVKQLRQSTALDLPIQHDHRNHYHVLSLCRLSVFVFRIFKLFSHKILVTILKTCCSCSWPPVVMHMNAHVYSYDTYTYKNDENGL